MSRVRMLERRLRTLDTLEETIAALRSLSAQHFRDARSALGPARHYRTEVERFLAVLDPAPEMPGGPAGIVLVASDLGLVGDYTPRLVREALSLRQEVGPGPLLCLGRRGQAPLTHAGVEPTWLEPAPASTRSLPHVLVPLVERLLSLQQRGDLEALWLVAARFEGAGAYTPVRFQVLPLGPRGPDGTADAPRAQRHLSPSPYGTPVHLRSVIVREHLYAVLWETLLEAMASEHGRRLLTAESARAWLEDRSNTTRRAAAAARRETSTQEVLEIAAGARAADRASRDRV